MVAWRLLLLGSTSGEQWIDDNYIGSRRKVLTLDLAAGGGGVQRRNEQAERQ